MTTERTNLSERTYDVKYGCENCGHVFNKKVVKKKYAPRLLACPHCETRVAKKLPIKFSKIF